MTGKKSCVLSMILIFLFVFSGCNIISIDTVTSTDHTGDVIISPSAIANYDNYPDSTDGFLFNGNLLISGLRIINVDTGDVQTICNSPGCLHQDNDAGCMNNRYNTFSAFSAAYKNRAVFCADTNKSFEKSLYYVNTAGSDIKTLVSWGEYNTVDCCKKVLVSNHLFMVVKLRKTSITEDGYVKTDEDIVCLYDIDMDEGNITLVHQSETSFGAHVTGGLFYNNGVIYLEYSLQTKSFDEMGITEQEFYANYDEYIEVRVELQGIKNFAVVYDLNTRKCDSFNLMYNGREFMASGFMNQKLFSCDTSINKLVCYDLKTGEMSLWRKDLDISNIYQSSDFLLIKLNSSDPDKPAKYLIMTDGEENLKFFHSSEYNFNILNECPERLLIQEYKGDELLGNYESKEPVYIERESFLSWFS